MFFPKNPVDGQLYTNDLGIPYVYDATYMRWEISVSSSGGGGGPGVTGPQGAPGQDGSPGVTGPAGAGTTGSPGPQGPQGPQGIQGSPGSQGSPGVTGPAGLANFIDTPNPPVISSILKPALLFNETANILVAAITGSSAYVQVSASASQGATGPQGPPGTSGFTGSNNFVTNFRYTQDTGVPAGGVQYLKSGQNIYTSFVGDRIPLDSTLINITTAVDTIDPSNSYLVEILKDPSGVTGGIPIDSVLLPINTLGVSALGLTGAISAGSEIGGRISRVSGSGASAFNNIIVNISLSQ